MTKNASLRLLVTSGDGPAECRLAIRHTLGAMEKAAKKLGLSMVCDPEISGMSSDAASVEVTLSGSGIEAFAKSWHGTIKWTCQSPFRPNHKRQNWFIGVFELPPLSEERGELKPDELRFETLRVGGPGGQHQNKTESAVRATHVPTGLTVVARDERSQHRNKQLAVQRLQEKLAGLSVTEEDRLRRSQRQLHHELERGNPVRCFKGARFKEI
ncbi:MULTISPECIES: peptide chain release factor H [unclassified Pseudovibrio]|uniref:peptide chain release factor H n=1 Tax=unclassified Pseudovibrio TaxID=2627060 RepID=UPI0007AEE370|nr:MULTISPECIES: peptide chain release factor H [unclassified Pseudovibrio]KZL03803.1 Peptide chain release factor 2 [Pseudovibrio sp. W74]KZL09802.1 Peptide chain release factor 2 [Pseudovibrio sp. Ad14]